jgi:hypothetical protein
MIAHYFATNTTMREGIVEVTPSGEPAPEEIAGIRNMYKSTTVPTANKSMIDTLSFLSNESLRPEIANRGDLSCCWRQQREPYQQMQIVPNHSSLSPGNF